VDEIGADIVGRSAQRRGSPSSRTLLRQLTFEDWARSSIGVALGFGITFLGHASVAVMLMHSLDRTREPFRNLRMIFDTSEQIHAERGTRSGGRGAVDAEGSAAFRFPPSVALTPAVVPCGRRVAPDPSLWLDPTWQALDFAVTERHRFAYQYNSRGSGEHAQFTVSAFGNLDCDDVLSTFVRFGTIRAGRVNGSAGLYRANEAE
jgi:hypothetical protein